MCRVAQRLTIHRTIRMAPITDRALVRLAAAEHRTPSQEVRRLVERRIAEVEAAGKATAPEVTGADREDQPTRAAGRVEF